MRHAGKNAGLRDGRVAFVFEYAADGNALVTKIFQEHPSGLVVTHDPDWQDIHAQVRQVIRGIGPASGHDGALAMFQNQDWSFARHARNLPKNKLVGYQVSQQRHRDVGECFDDLFQAVGFFEVLRHECDGSPNCSAG